LLLFRNTNLNNFYKKFPRYGSSRYHNVRREIPVLCRFLDRHQSTRCHTLQCRHIDLLRHGNFKSHTVILHVERTPWIIRTLPWRCRHRFLRKICSQLPNCTVLRFKKIVIRIITTVRL
jgi:hypothetical protein